MAEDVATPGWYYAEGDPAGTSRYWDGMQWTTEPQWDPATAPPPYNPGSLPVHGDFRQPGSWNGPASAPFEPSVWESYRHVLQHNYANFNGRARRKEYWGFVLVNTLITIAIYAPGALILDLTDHSLTRFGVIPLGLGILYAFATMVPAVAAAVRRFHDTDRSGAWCFIALLPYLGALVLFVMLMMDGTPGPNQYGPDTKRRQ